MMHEHTQQQQQQQGSAVVPRAHGTVLNTLCCYESLNDHMLIVSMDDNMSIILFVRDIVIIMRKQPQQKPARTYSIGLPPQ